MSDTNFQPQPINVLLITVKQAAEVLQLSERTVNTMIDTGKLESIKIGDARRIPLEAIRRIAANGCELPTLAERAANSKGKRGRRPKIETATIR